MMTNTFILYKLAAKVFLGCAHARRQGEVIAGIIYTDEKYKRNALPLAPFMEKEKCCLTECFTEIVLTDFTVDQLMEIDPRLVILAPFTIPSNTDKISLREREGIGKKV